MDDEKYRIGGRVQPSRYFFVNYYLHVDNFICQWYTLVIKDDNNTCQNEKISCHRIHKKGEWMHGLGKQTQGVPGKD